MKETEGETRRQQRQQRERDGNLWRQCVCEREGGGEIDIHERERES
jgi:hypothetical protein